MLLLKIVVLQTIIFGLVLFFLKKILSGDTESAVNRLNESYEEVKNKKEELSKRMTEMEAEYSKKKEEAEKIGVQLLEKSKEDAEAKKDDIIKAAKKEAEEIITKAMSTVDNIRMEIEKETQLKTMDFCGQVMQDIFTQKSAEEIHEVFVGEFIDDLKGLDMSKINQDIRKIDIISLRPLSEENKQLIREIISQKLKRDVTLSESTDSKLLGGMVLSFEGLVLDGSLAGRIREGIVERKKKIESSGKT